VADKAPLAVTTESGATGYINPELAAVAAQSGARAATAEELRSAQIQANAEAQEAALQARFSGSAGAVLEGTFGPRIAGGLRGLSAGLSDQALISGAGLIGGDGAREDIRGRLNAYREFSPIESTGSELAAIGGAALLGNESALAGAPGLIGRLGAAGEAATLRALGRGAIARGAGIAVRGGFEGAAFGAGTAISESALGNTDLSGEALIAGAKHGGMAGAVANLALHGAGSAVERFATGLRAPKASAYDALAAREFGEAAPGVGKNIAKTAEGGPYRAPSIADDVAEKYIQTTSSGADDASRLREIWANRQKTLGKGADALEEHSRGVSKAIDEQLSAARVVDQSSFGEAKVNQMSRLVDQERFAEQARATVDWMHEANNIVGALDGAAGAGQSTRNKWAAHMQRIGFALESGESVKLHTAIDDLKRFVGQEANFGRRAVNTAQKEFDHLYQGENGLKQFLESDVWGAKASMAQKEINAATHSMISEGELFSQRFTTKFGSDVGRPSYTASTEAVDSFLNRLTSAKNALNERGVSSYIEARGRFLDAVSKNYEFAPQVQKAIATERAALAKMDETIKTAAKDVSLINQTKRLLDEEKTGAIGGMVGLLADTATKPGTTMRRLAQIEENTQRVLKRLGGETRTFLGAEAGAKAPELAAPKGARGFFSTMLDDGAKPAGTSRERYAQRAEQVTKLQANPAMVASRVGSALRDVSDAAPKTTQVATATALRGLQFLSDKLPPSRRDQFSLQPQLQPKTRASDAEISRFMRYAEAIDDPVIVLREAKAGTLTRDHVEAVKAVYPALHEQMRGEVMNYLMASKRDLPYARRIQLGILLDIPTDKTLSPDFMRAVQATFTSAEQAGAESPPPSFARTVDVAGSAQTATQRAVERVE
jgi:hypothetical protein